MSNKSVDVKYIDFSKAFDKVDHRLLLEPLKAHQFGDGILLWIESFLKNRKQKIKVNGTLSKDATVISGIPQGTILGPLLFILLISPLSQLLAHSRISSYVDDTKIIQGHIDDNYGRLQQDLEELYKWVDLNNMALNGENFFPMAITPYLPNTGIIVDLLSPSKTRSKI